MKYNVYYSWKEEFSILSSVIEVIQPVGFTWSPYCDTHVTQSYFIFCADSQDLGYNIDIKLSGRMTKSGAKRKLLTLNFLTCSCNALNHKDIQKLCSFF